MNCLADRSSTHLTILIDLPPEGAISSRKRLDCASADANNDNYAFNSSDTITTACTTPEEDDETVSLSVSELNKLARISQQQAKTVRFQTDADNNIVPLVLGTSRSEYMNVTWWSPQEMLMMHAHAFAVVDLFSKYRDYTNAVRSMVSDCAQTGASQLCLRTADALPNIIGSSARGLETCTVEVLQRRRDRIRRQLMKKQNMLRKCNHEKRSHLLFMQYHDMTSYATLWAQLLADGDALVAADTITKQCC
jgi:hypothetical protein